MPRPFRSSFGALVVAVSLVAAACAGGGDSSNASPPRRSATTATTTASSTPPNIVFVLADDLSWNLINEQFTPNVMSLERRGETFDHYFVADSLCCPSRSSIFTGLFPHDTKVATNLPPDGGFQKFQSEHLDQRSYAVALAAHGYQTSMMGKYLNGYGDPMNATTAPIPPGWSDWHVSNSTGYAEFNFRQNDNGTYNSYTGQQNYGVDVLNTKAQSFIKQSAGKPFAIEIATYAPHQPYTPAPRNANDFPGLTQPRDPSFDNVGSNPPSWLAGRGPLTPKALRQIERAYRKRAQAMEAVDKLLGDIETTLAAEHLSDNTYIVFSSDNGYHLGQHRLVQGKKTAFDTDIRVPLVVAGPGVPHGKVVSQVAQNVDLAPTFLELAGAKPAAPVEGHSLVSLLHPTVTPAAWRTVALVEHEQTTKSTADPDYEAGVSDPPSYTAIRLSNASGDAVYVEYHNAAHEIEYYDISKDPYEIHNIASTLSARDRARLHATLGALVHCHTATSCWRAAQPQ